MILFVGNRERGAFIEDVASQYRWGAGYIAADVNIRNQVQAILKEPDVNYIVYDISQYGNDAEEITDVITRIYKANNAKPIIFAEGYNEKMAVIRCLYFGGVNAFIFASMLSDKKNELKRYIEGECYQMSDEPDAGEGNGNNNEPINVSTARTIGIAGATGRMGTTTQALQFVKYLLLKGYRVCYIQMNNHKWVEELSEAYAEVDTDDELGRVTYKNVDMYYKLERLSEVLKEGYDFFVYDYGVYSEWDFNKISFLEKEIQAFVVGTKPGEFNKTYDVVENNFYRNVYYIFNFIPDTEEEHQDTYELMEGKEDMTFFAPDCRDPFVFSGSDIYEKILPVEAILPDEKKKKRFFRRKKK